MKYHRAHIYLQIGYGHRNKLCRRRRAIVFYMRTSPVCCFVNRDLLEILNACRCICVCTISTSVIYFRWFYVILDVFACERERNRKSILKRTDRERGIQKVCMCAYIQFVYNSVIVRDNDKTSIFCHDICALRHIK